MISTTATRITKTLQQHGVCPNDNDDDDDDDVRFHRSSSSSSSSRSRISRRVRRIILVGSFSGAILFLSLCTVFTINGRINNILGKEHSNNNNKGIRLLQVKDNIDNDNNDDSNKDDDKRNTRIPHIMWFTYKHNVLETKEPKNIYDNVVHTIVKYQIGWNNEFNATINFLDDELCSNMIQLAYSKLVYYFNTEFSGPYKSDICRTAALYLQGGYYFDVDLQVINVMHPKPNSQFVTTLGCRGECFYQAFIASIPKHRLLKTTLHRMYYIYKNRRDVNQLGPNTMSASYFKGNPFMKGDIELLDELLLDTVKAAGNNNDESQQQQQQQLVHYPDLERQKGGVLCNYVLHDPKQQIPYFYARFVGYGALCQANDDNKV